MSKFPWLAFRLEFSRVKRWEGRVGFPVDTVLALKEECRVDMEQVQNAELRENLKWISLTAADSKDCSCKLY